MLPFNKSTFIKDIIIFFIVFFVIGGLTLYVLFSFVSSIEYMKTGNSIFFGQNSQASDLELLRSLIDGTVAAVPFEDLLDLLLEDGMSTIPNLFISLKKADFPSAWESYKSGFLRDISVTAMGCLFFFFLTGFQKLFGEVKNLFLSLAFSFLSILWLFTAYAASEWLLLVLESIVIEKYLKLLYVIVFVVAFLIRILLLAFSVKLTVPRVALILVVRMIFDIMRTTSAILLRIPFNQLYSPDNALLQIFNPEDVLWSLLSFIAFGFILKIFEITERFILLSNAR